MSILGTLLFPRPRANDPADDKYYDNLEDSGVIQLGGGGVPMSPELALRIVTVFACVRYISESMASLPLPIYEREDQAEDEKHPSKREARDHPLWTLFHFAPNRWQNPFEFIEMLTGHAALRGNGYARILPGPNGAVDELIPLHPGRMRVIQLDNYRLQYRYTYANGKTDTYTQDEIFHLRGFGSDGLVGLSPVAMAREALGLAVATQGYGSRFFSGFARPGGVLEHPAKLGKEARERLRQDWQNLHSGLHNAHKVAILEEGLKWHQVGITAEDAQFLETRKYQRSEIASLWRVPPHKVGIMDNATFTNIEHQAIEAVTDCLMSWARRWESAIAFSLITEPERYFARFKLQAMLRGDTQVRYAAYATAHTTGWMSVNDIRESEDMNPIPGGDEYLKPMNMAPAGSNPLKQQQEGEGGTPGVKKKVPDDRMAVFMADAAERIANHEIRELMKRVPKMAEREKFHDWVESFYEAHTAYVTRVLAPFVSGCGLSPDVVTTITKSGRDAWMAAEPPQFPLWSATRATEIANHLQAASIPAEEHSGKAVRQTHWEATTGKDGVVSIKKVYTK